MCLLAKANGGGWHEMLAAKQKSPSSKRVAGLAANQAQIVRLLSSPERSMISVSAASDTGAVD